MSETSHKSVGLSPKPSETTLPTPNSELLENIQVALKAGNKIKLETLTANNPREPFCWAALSILNLDAQSKVSSYAFARIGYHRGLDSLRANGWRGSGYVRAQELGNRGFLASLALLGQLATEIGEVDEVKRCGEFLAQLDPKYDWNTFASENPIDFMFKTS